jgi:pyridoxal phosphate enzyme (YggS family)
MAKKDPFYHIEKNIKYLKERIYEIAISSGRDYEEIKLIAVSKNRPAAMISKAIECGINIVGENRVQEAKEKFLLVEYEADWHLVGVLQSNKAKDAVKLFSTVHSVYKKNTAESISKYAVKENKNINILIEVNTSLEPTKAGIKEEEELLKLIYDIKDIPNINIIGLMTIAENTQDEVKIGKCFERLRLFLESAKKEFPELPLTELSMGMTNDYEIAIKEGSTMLRIGRAIFEKQE